MPPQGQTGGSWVLYETDAVNVDTEAPVIVPPSAEKREWKIVWRNVILMGLLHIGGVYGAYLFLTTAMWRTSLFGKFYNVCNRLNFRIKKTTKNFRYIIENIAFIQYRYIALKLYLLY